MNIGTTTKIGITSSQIEKVIVIKSPMPDQVAWHELTNWRYAETLYKDYKHIWNKLRKEGVVPHHVLKMVLDKVN